MEKNFYIYNLASIEGITNVQLLKMITFLEEIKWQTRSINQLAKIACIHASQRKKIVEHFENEAIQTRIQLQFEQEKFITILDTEYPEKLTEIYNPPAILFYSGNLDLLQQKSLAMVGSRKATENGKELIKKFVPELVKNDLVIVSGLAKGIDTCAHQQTIQNHGKTIAVIGSGLNIYYPKENERLQRYIGTHHLLLSEYPFHREPKAYHFPLRNRIIAGITKGTCVIEAKEKSGTLITAQYALESGREVFCIPGNTLSGNSQGCHKLIQQGAKCIWKPQHIIEEI